MAVTIYLLLLAVVGQTLATEVHINSGGNGESTSVAAAASEAVQVTTETLVTAATASPASKAVVGDTIDDLDKAETKDPTKKLEIIKQIRKINKDGSYTVGYEAGDGTFKIESRDVLGNIKGTYGYVDAQGEIKRVSYNGNNGTSALKNFPTEITVATAANETEPEELSTTPPNVNAVAPPAALPQRTSLRSMRRPQSLKFLSTTAAPSTFGPKSNYIQTIPKRRLLVPSSTERSQYSHYATDKTTDRQHPRLSASTNSNQNSHNNQATPTSANPNNNDDNDEQQQQTPTTIVYAKTVPTQKPLIILRPTTQATSTSHTQEQISRPDKLEINHVSKVMVMKSSETSTSKSVHASSDKENDRKSIRGNNLRRQLAQEREDHYEAQPQQLYAHNAGEDSQHIFDGATGNLRPLYSTTSRPRVPSIVLAARQRAAQLQNALNSNSAPTTTTEKVYVRPPPAAAAAIQYETTTNEPAQESPYLTQSPSGTVVQIPANQGISQQATEDQGAIYGQRPAPFSLRQQHHPSGAFQGTEAPNSLFRFPPPPSARGDQFLRETTPSSSSAKHREDVDESGGVYGRPAQQRSRGGYDGEAANYQQGSFPVPYQQQNPYGYFPGQTAPYNFPQRPPVTTRDFEMLLQLLQNRNRFGGGGGYGGGGGGGLGFNANPYNPNIGPYLSNPYQGLQQYPRYDPIGFDPRYGYNSNSFGGFRQYSEPQNSIYQSPQTADASQTHQPQYMDQRGIGRPQRPFTGSNSNYYGANTAPAINPYQQQAVSRGGSAGAAPYYQPDFSNVQQSYATQASTQQDYLPSEVREDLLYRMLMLAIQNPNSGYYDNHQQMPPPPPQIGAFSDPIKSVLHTPNVATGESAAEGSAPVQQRPHHHHSYHSQEQQPQYHQNHRGSINNNLVQMATRKPVRSVQIIGEAEE